MAPMKLMHIGIKGRVIGINRSSGRIQWETRLKGSGFTNVSLEGKHLYAATKGELWALNPSTGSILWHQSLPGKGYGYICLANSPDGNLGALSAQLESDSQAGAAAGGGAV